ncbi:speriolin-like protein [Diadema antillarum]|uniref:speriolin-like protein n=1 Tax=Diadema antillarum TaxID=105358 RepID=UPI003A83A6D0
MSSPETVIIGEVAFQLERTILAMVFRGGSKQLTGYTLSNMEKMLHSHYDIGQRPALEMQLREVEGNLNICGWKPDYHPKLIADLIRTYGTFPSNAVTSKLVKKHGWTDPRTLKETILWGIPKERIHDMIIILDCLIYLSRKANIPLFTW